MPAKTWKVGSKVEVLHLFRCFTHAPLPRGHFVQRLHGMSLSSYRFPEAGYSNEIEVLVETDDRTKCPASWMELDLSFFPSYKVQTGSLPTPWIMPAKSWKVSWKVEVLHLFRCFTHTHTHTPLPRGHFVQRLHGMSLSSYRFPKAGYSNEIEVLVETDDRTKCPASWMELDSSFFPSYKVRLVRCPLRSKLRAWHVLWMQDRCLHRPTPSIQGRWEIVQETWQPPAIEKEIG